jgi:hypothetical protein
MQDTNPDALLAVRFYQNELENAYLTTAEGRPIKYMADFVRIEVPGNMTSIIDTIANDDHKRRFPIQWAQYMNDKTAESDVQGTLLRDWPLLTSAQASELKHFKFYTVEQVAQASDQQIQAVGMMVGMSPFAFRDKARARLAQAKDSAVVEAQADELRKREQENQSLRDELARLSQLIETKKPGRPKKETEEA